jgi:hypothetical protein
MWALSDANFGIQGLFASGRPQQDAIVAFLVQFEATSPVDNILEQVKSGSLVRYSVAPSDSAEIRREPYSPQFDVKILECLLWVKLRKHQAEHISSASAPKAEVRGRGRTSAMCQ